MAIAALYELSHDYVLSEYFFILVSIAVSYYSLPFPWVDSSEMWLMSLPCVPWVDAYNLKGGVLSQQPFDGCDLKSSINQPTNQPTNQSINQSTNQPIAVPTTTTTKTTHHPTSSPGLEQGIITSVVLMVEDERHGAVLRRYVVDGDGQYHDPWGHERLDHRWKETEGEVAPLVGGGGGGARGGAAAGKNGAGYGDF